MPAIGLFLGLCRRPWHAEDFYIERGKKLQCKREGISTAVQAIDENSLGDYYPESLQSRCKFPVGEVFLLPPVLDDGLGFPLVELARRHEHP